MFVKVIAIIALVIINAVGIYLLVTDKSNGV